MRIAWCDCFSGISGDMFAGALIDAGLDIALLRQELSKLGLADEFSISAEVTRKKALRCIQFRVHEKHEHHEAHSHHQQPLMPSLSRHERHTHHHNSYRDIVKLIESSALIAAVKEKALAIFAKLAAAEAKVHGVAIDDVHFHEVGAIDSIVDIVTAAIGLDALGIEKLYSSPLPIGSGRMKMAHGELPLPAPATAELIASAGMVTTPSTATVELVTPTGAAILAAFASFERIPMTIERIGTGCGERDTEWPNVMRLLIGETGEIETTSDTVLLETNIDDMSPEIFGHVMERLLTAGCLDVFFTPIQMKKNRPATMLSAICRTAEQGRLADIILRETTSLGVRVRPLERYEAERKIVTVTTKFGEIPVKVKLLGGEAVSASPEYEPCAAIAREQNVPLKEVFAEAAAAVATSEQLKFETKLAS